MTAAVLSQSHFRARKDNATVDVAPEWIANEDTNFTWQTDSPFRIRFKVQETAGGNPAAATVKLQANLNGGAFFDVTTSSTIVKAVLVSATAEDTAIATNRLTGTGTYAQGRYSADGSPATNVDIGSSGNSEWEFGVVINSADVANADTISMKVVALSGTAITATTSPTITVSEVATATTAGFFEAGPPPLKRKPASKAAVAMAMVTAFTLTPPPAPGISTTIASVYDETTVISRNVVYDSTVAPPALVPAATPSTLTFDATPALNARTKPLSRPSGHVVYVPQEIVVPATISTTIASAFDETTVLRRWHVYDPLAAPPKLIEAATPSILALVQDEPPRRAKQRAHLLSSFVFEIPDDILEGEFYDQPRPTKKPRRALDNPSWPPQIIAAAPAATTPSALDFDATPALNRRAKKVGPSGSTIVHAPQEIAAPAAISTTIACVFDETTVRTRYVIYDMTTGPVGEVQAPVVDPGQVLSPQNNTVRKVKRVQQLSAFVFEIPDDILEGEFYDQPRPTKKLRRQLDNIPWDLLPTNAYTPTQLGFIPFDAPPKRKTSRLLGAADISFSTTPPPFVITTPEQLAFMGQIDAPSKVRYSKIAWRLNNEPLASPPGEPIVVDVAVYDDYIIRARRRGRR
jgi:hypothetical protein